MIAWTVADLRQATRRLPRPFGFVPTMGALHEGHASLIRRAADENRAVVVSIFVNPKQFAPSEDLARYPRPLDRDLALAESAGADLVFHPSVAEMYPAGFSTTVEVGGISARWEGERRPGHFAGVATVVARLLLLVGADRAYFGEKDYQQLQVVRQLVADLAIPTAIVGCPTVRDADGLALSSRNGYLSDSERQQALALPRALHRAVALAATGEREVARIEHAMREMASAPGVTIEYLAVVDKDTLEPLTTLSGEARVLGAVRVGATRLIDNCAIGGSLGGGLA